MPDSNCNQSADQFVDGAWPNCPVQKKKDIPDKILKLP